MLEIPTTKTHAILRMLTSPSNRVILFSGSKQSIEPKPPTSSHRLSKLHNPWSNRFRQPPKFVRKHPIDNLKSIQELRINTQVFHVFNSEKEPSLKLRLNLCLHSMMMKYTMRLPLRLFTRKETHLEKRNEKFL